MAVKNPYALSFDGSNDYVKVTNPIKLQFGTGDFSVECWAKRNVDTDTGTKKIIEIGASDLFTTSGRRGWCLKYYSGTKIYATASYGDSSKTVDVYTDGSYDYRDGLWHHIAATFDRDGNITLYVDGVNKMSASMTSITNVNDTSNKDLYIGTNYNASGQFLPGSVDEIRIWNYVITQNQINAFKRRRLVESETGLVGYYRFDEGTGTTANDSASNPVNGAISGASWIAGVINLGVASGIGIGSPMIL